MLRFGELDLSAQQVGGVSVSGDVTLPTRLLDFETSVVYASLATGRDLKTFRGCCRCMFVTFALSAR